MSLDEDLREKYLSLIPEVDFPTETASKGYAYERGGVPIRKIPSEVLKSKNLRIVKKYSNYRLEEYISELNEFKDIFEHNKKVFGGREKGDRYEAKGKIELSKFCIDKKTYQINRLIENVAFAKKILDAEIKLDLVIGEYYFLYEKRNKLSLEKLSPLEIPTDNFVAVVEVLPDHTLKQVYWLNK